MSRDGPDVGVGEAARAVADRRLAGWLRRFYAFSGLIFARPEAAIWILFLRSRGLGLAAIGVAEVFYHIGGTLGQLPSGIFADRRGRQHALALGCLIQAACWLLILRVHTPWGAWAVLAGSGLGAACVSGADRGLLYARMVMSGRQADYPTASGRVYAVEDGVGTLATAAGGVLASVSYTLAMGSRAVLALAAAALTPGLALPMRGRAPASEGGAEPVVAPSADGPSAAGEPPRDPPGAGRGAVGLRPALVATLGRRGPLRSLTLYATAYGVLTTLGHLWAQVLLADKGASLTLVGVGLGLGSLAAAAGGLAARRAPDWVRRLAPAVTGAAWAAAALLPGAVGAIAAMLPGYFLEGIFYPYLDAAVQRHAPEQVRATVLSAQSTLFSAGMIAAFPAFGALLGARGPAAFLALLPPLLVLAALARMVTASGDSTPRAAAAAG